MERYPVKPMNGGKPMNGLYQELASSPDWSCEAKMDGRRAWWDGDWLWSREGNKLYDAEDMRKLLKEHFPDHRFDGELVEPYYWVLDLPEHGGVYEVRRSDLLGLVTGKCKKILAVPNATWDDVDRFGYEGVVFKKHGTLYKTAHRPGVKTSDWIKFRKELL